MKLIFFGGVKGVGKTTLLKWLKRQLGNQIRLLDPGELFRRYFYDEKLMTTDAIEEMIVKKLKKMPDDSVVAVHWHYSVLLPSGPIPQISFSRLRRLAESGKIEHVILFVIRAPISVLRDRRLKDSHIKKRKTSKSAIAKEIRIDNDFLIKHFVLFSETLGRQKVNVFWLTNADLKEARVALNRFFKKSIFVHRPQDC